MCVESHILHAGLRQEGAISFEINTLFWMCDKLEGKISGKQIPHALQCQHVRNTRQTQLRKKLCKEREGDCWLDCIFFLNHLYEKESNFDSATNQYICLYLHIN